MIMHKDNRCGRFLDRRLKCLSGMDDAGRQTACRNIGFNFNDTVFVIQQYSQKGFLFLSPKLLVEVLEDIVAALKLLTEFNESGRKTLGNSQSSLDLRSPRRSYAFRFTQF